MPNLLYVSGAKYLIVFEAFRNRFIQIFFSFLWVNYTVEGLFIMKSIVLFVSVFQTRFSLFIPTTVSGYIFFFSSHRLSWEAAVLIWICSLVSVMETSARSCRIDQSLFDHICFFTLSTAAVYFTTNHSHICNQRQYCDRISKRRHLSCINLKKR